MKIIEVENLVKKFGSFVANDHLTFSVDEGEIYGFLGANGAGKTTAMKILCGLSAPTSGKVMVAGYDVYRQSEMIKKRIGYMSQRFSLFEDLIGMGEFPVFRRYLRTCQRQKLKREPPNCWAGWDWKVKKTRLLGSLPLGWKQKLAFSVAIIHQPSIVFLDEPTGGVDPITRRQFWEIIYETASQGITVFVTTHYMDEAEYCHRVSIMADGKIVALDTPANLKAKYNAANIEEVFLKIARN